MTRYTAKMPSSSRLRCAHCGKAKPYKGVWLFTYPISQSLPAVRFCSNRCRIVHAVYTAQHVRNMYKYHNDAVLVGTPETELAGYVVAFTDTTFSAMHRYHYMEVRLCRLLLSARSRWAREWEASELVDIRVLQELPSGIVNTEMLRAAQIWRQRLTPVTIGGQETPKPYERGKKRLTR
jgi:hypothetical protein